MDLTQRLNELESARDWQGLADALEQAIEQEQDPNAKAGYFLRLGRVMTNKLLQGPRALKHFQNAWKLRPQDVVPLVEARDIYWDLGKFKMVETVLKRSLETAGADVRSGMLAELGDVACDLGNYDAAAEHYQAAADDGGPMPQIL